MGLLSNFRDGSLLKRMVTALESLAESQRRIADVLESEHAPESPLADVKPLTISTFDQQSANAQYKQRVMEEQGMASDEEYEAWKDSRL